MWSFEGWYLVSRFCLRVDQSLIEELLQRTQQISIYVEVIMCHICTINEDFWLAH